MSIGTGLNTFASSSEGREAGGAPNASGVRSACSMRVKSPCAAAVGGGAGGAGAGVGAEAITSAAGVENMGDAGGAKGAAIGAGAAGGGGVKAGGGGAVAGGEAGLPVRAASRSSSSRGGGVETAPKIPVALEEPAPADSFGEGGCGLSERSLNASI